MNIIFDNGHGGLINGVYQTKGKRSPIWNDGTQLYEGVFNRNIVNKLIKLCDSHSIDYVNLVPEQSDISLETRVKRANNVYKQRRDSILISIHANAGGGTGYEVFTTPGVTKSDEIAEVMILEYGKTIPQLRLRKDTRDGDLDKEAHFYIIKNTHCPAILIECAFMDYESDCRLMMEDEDLFVEAIFNGILEIKKSR